MEHVRSSYPSDRIAVQAAMNILGWSPGQAATILSIFTRSHPFYVFIYAALQGRPTWSCNVLNLDRDSQPRNCPVPIASHVEDQV